MAVATIVPRNQSLAVAPFSMFHQPPLVPGTSGVARPKPGAKAVLCIAPGQAVTYNEKWGQELTLHPGEPHLAITASDTYPNQVFSRDYVLVGEVASTHPLAVTLGEFWETHGFGQEELREAWLQYLDSFTAPPQWADGVRYAVSQNCCFFLAEKRQPVIVRGVVDLRLMTSEGPTLVEHGSVLVSHPDDATNQWLIRAGVFAERYNWVQEPSSGLLIPDVQ